MDRSDSNETGKEKLAGASADRTKDAVSNTDNESGDLDARPSAIERQKAAEAARDLNKQVQEDADSFFTRLRNTRSQPDQSERRSVGMERLLVLLLLAACGLAFVFTDIGDPLKDAATPALVSAKKILSSFDAYPERALQADVATSMSRSAVDSQKAPEQPPSIAQNEASGPPPTNAVAVPVGDVTLRERPQLLEQLVQVYRAKLQADPGNTEAIAALERLQNRSLSELEGMVSAGDEAIAISSLELVSRLFPDLVDDIRYHAILERTSQFRTEAQQEREAPPAVSSAKDETPQLEAASSAANNAAPAGSIQPSAVPAVEKSISAGKPDVRVLSITPGRIEAGNFVAGEGGNVFMVVINYRNFDKNLDSDSTVELVARLGMSGNPQALAEVPVVLYGGRGTKSFAVETVVAGYVGETYKLNFLIGEELLTSRSARLSMVRE